MPRKSVKLPSGRTVEIIYFGDLNSCASYLHYKRYGLYSDATEKAKLNLYQYKCEHEIIPSLAKLLAALMPHLFTLIVVPSSGNDANIYRERIFADFNGRDLSDQFHKNPSYKASENSEHPEKTLEAITYDTDGLEEQIERLVILDDIFATGGTIDAVVERLYQAGMPKEAEIIVVTPLIAKHNAI